MAARVTRTESCDLVEPEGGVAPLVLTCEHASARLPVPLRWHPDDWRLYGTHWSYDIGAAELTAELAAHLGCPAVRSRFTRLFCDANRRLDAVELFWPGIEGRPVEMNRDLAPEQRSWRLDTYYQPFHDAIDAAVRARADAMVLSIHSFTPIWQGQPRDFDVGVLFDVDEALARAVAYAIEDHGLRVRLNEPYTGKNGGMFSAQSHATRNGRPALELEIRQDHAGSLAWRERFVEVVRRALVGVLGGWGSATSAD